MAASGTQDLGGAVALTHGCGPAATKLLGQGRTTAAVRSLTGQHPGSPRAPHAVVRSWETSAGTAPDPTHRQAGQHHSWALAGLTLSLT